MASNWSVCGVCDYRHITKPSVVWCSECDEGLCEECKDHHSISKGTRSHGTVSIAEYQKLPNKVLQLAHSCSRHNEKYVLFCKKHDCPCCKKCVVESHKECKELTDIDDITRNIKSSNACVDIEQTLSEIAENIKRLRINRKENLASIGKKSKEIQKEVLETRARINLHLDKLQDTIMKDLKTKEEEESNIIRRLLKTLKDKEIKNTEHQTNIANIKQYASDLQMFLALKQIEKDVSVDAKYIQSIVKNVGAYRIAFSCKINPLLQGLISAIQTFGDIVVTADPREIQILKQKDKQAQMMVASTPMAIDNLTPTLQHIFDTKLSVVRGCTFLPDCRMILSCNAKYILRVYKADGSLDFDIGDFGPVIDVAYIRNNLVAVTSGYYRYSLQINLIDLIMRKVEKTLKVNTVNFGVAYHDGKLIYCAGIKGIQMINLKDETITNVTSKATSPWSYVATLEDKIFYTDYYTSKVTCIDFQGNKQWVFENYRVLRNPVDLSVDGDGNVYVVGCNNVVIISPNGQNYRELLTSANKLQSPVVIDIDRSNNKMLVANSKDKAFIYDLK